LKEDSTTKMMQTQHQASSRFIEIQPDGYTVNFNAATIGSNNNKEKKMSISTDQLATNAKPSTEMPAKLKETATVGSNNYNSSSKSTNLLLDYNSKLNQTRSTSLSSAPSIAKLKTIEDVRSSMFDVLKEIKNRDKSKFLLSDESLQASSSNNNIKNTTDQPPQPVFIIRSRYDQQQHQQKQQQRRQREPASISPINDSRSQSVTITAEPPSQPQPHPQSEAATTKTAAAESDEQQQQQQESAQLVKKLKQKFDNKDLSFIKVI
jgi:hypothetical protein